jgi:uncharacterized protein
VKEPKIEFPCDYPVKVIGRSAPDFLDQVVAIVRRHDTSITMDRVKEKPSREGNYTSITVSLRATGEPQLKAMFGDLKQCPNVQMVL